MSHNLKPENVVHHRANGNEQFLAFAIHPADIDSKTITSWQSLEQRALIANAYLSPHFVLPALNHLKSEKEPLVVLVERCAEGKSTLVGLGVFELCPPSRHLPLWHLSSYLSRHSYLSDLLVDRAHAEAVTTAFFDFFQRPGARWHGVKLVKRQATGPFADMIEKAALERKIEWNEFLRQPRAILSLADMDESYLQTHLSSGRQKDLRRRMRRLGDHGEVAWRSRSGAEVTNDCIDRFIELEHLGWKGNAGTSLRATRCGESFFRDMVSSFNDSRQIFFTELTINDVVVASTSNLISGAAGFAFKLGWDPAFAKASPGLLNEVELIRNAPKLYKELEYMDSGASEGSFMDELWSKRHLLTSGIYSTTRIGKQALRAVKHLRSIKHWLALKTYLLIVGSSIEAINSSSAALLYL